MLPGLNSGSVSTDWIKEGAGPTNQFDCALLGLDHLLGQVLLQELANSLGVPADGVGGPLGVHPGGIGLQVQQMSLKHMTTDQY